VSRYLLEARRPGGGRLKSNSFNALNGRDDHLGTSGAVHSDARSTTRATVCWADLESRWASNWALGTEQVRKPSGDRSVDTYIYVGYPVLARRFAAKLHSRDEGPRQRLLFVGVSTSLLADSSIHQDGEGPGQGARILRWWDSQRCPQHLSGVMLHYGTNHR
jgi:hypothetical protein